MKLTECVYSLTSNKKYKTLNFFLKDTLIPKIPNFRDFTDYIDEPNTLHQGQYSPMLKLSHLSFLLELSQCNTLLVEKSMIV